MPEGGTPTTLEDALKVITTLTKERDDAASERDDWKQKSRKWEDTAKANKDAAPDLEKAKQRIAELEAAQDSGKTELEKQVAKMTDDIAALTKRAEDAEASATTERLAALRTRIGTEKGVPAHLIDRLIGEDEESITADAEKVVEGLPKQPKKPGVPGQGKTGEPIDTDEYKSAIDRAFGDSPKPNE